MIVQVIENLLFPLWRQLFHAIKIEFEHFILLRYKNQSYNALLSEDVPGIRHWNAQACWEAKMYMKDAYQLRKAQVFEHNAIVQSAKVDEGKFIDIVW